MLDVFQWSQQATSVFIYQEGKAVTKAGYSRLDGIAKEYDDRYDLTKYFA